ncbi:MAG: hypothetical protein EA411_11160 [Saprospirales bacterium]|nr:MAG: hypothetical protein EA411_11160 [Saprospirales bacterium]
MLRDFIIPGDRMRNCTVVSFPGGFTQTAHEGNFGVSGDPVQNVISGREFLTASFSWELDKLL